MKKIILVVCCLALMLSCKSFQSTGNIDFIIGAKAGTIWMRDGKIINFSRSAVTATIKTVRINSELVHMTILWTNIDKILVENYSLEEKKQDTKTVTSLSKGSDKIKEK